MTPRMILCEMIKQRERRLEGAFENRNYEMTWRLDLETEAIRDVYERLSQYKFMDEQVK